MSQMDVARGGWDWMVSGWSEVYIGYNVVDYIYEINGPKPTAVDNQISLSLKLFQGLKLPLEKQD